MLPKTDPSKSITYKNNEELIRLALKEYYYGSSAYAEELHKKIQNVVETDKKEC